MIKLKKYPILIAVMIVVLITGFISTANAAVKQHTSEIVQKFTGKHEEVSDNASIPAKTSVQDTVNEQEKQQKQDNQAKAFGDILQENGIISPASGLKILVDKSDHTLSLIYNGMNLKSYHVELGSGGTEDKQVEGDRKTPEGIFYVTNKEVIDPTDDYLGTRWLGVSYPNAEDANRGLSQGLIDEQTYVNIIDTFNSVQNPPQDSALGGNIGIHGGSVPSLGSNWTWGCIGLSNADIEDFYNYITVGTPIIVQQ